MALRSLFIDYNGFFASCEQQEDPSLRGRPVAVAPLAAETTCCIAASYDAKKCGIKTGTRVAEARIMCPGIVILPSRPEVYIRYHEKLKKAVESCLPLGAVESIDELWCELPPASSEPRNALAMARKVKAAVRQLAGECLTCSIGLAPNPWLAKIASDLEKPDGLTVITLEELPGRLHPLELRDLPGIGRNMELRLRSAGITTVAALTDASRNKLRSVWGGIEGERMWRRLRGEYVLNPATHTSSIGHSHVLPPELRNEDGARSTLHRLLQKAAMRLRAAGYFARGLHLGLRYTRDRKRWGTALSFTDTQDTRELIRVLNLLWDRRPGASCRASAVERTFDPMAPVDGYIGVGITLFDLVPAEASTLALPGIIDTGERRQKLNTALDDLNKRMGKNTVVFGGALGSLSYAPIRIAFTRIPSLELEEGAQPVAQAAADPDSDHELEPDDTELERARRAFSG